MKTLAAVVLLLLAAPALAQRYTAAAVNSTAGGGGGGIVASISATRTSGSAPLCVRFSAYGSTVPTGFDAFGDPYYLWDFGDVGAGTWTPDGRTKETDVGPVAAHCFESGGTKTVRVTVYVNNTSATTTQDIVVTASNDAWPTTQTMCVGLTQPVAGSNGCPSGAQVRDSAGDFDLDLAACIAASAKRCLFNGGDSFAHDAQVSITAAGPGLISSYGTGKAILTGTSGVVRFDSGVDDWRITNFVQSGALANLTPFATIDNSDILAYDNITVMGIEGTGGHLWTEGWNQNIIYSSGLALVDNDWGVCPGRSGGNCVYAPGMDEMIVGNTISNTADGEHVVRMSFCTDCVVAHNYFGPTGNPASGKLLLKMHAWAQSTTPTGAKISEHNVIMYNEFEAGSNTAAILADIAPEDDFKDEWLRYILMEGNHGTSSTSTQKCARLAVIDHFWLRNNSCNMTGMTAGFAGYLFEQRGPSDLPTDIPDSLYAIQNTCYSDTAFAGACVSFNPSETAAPRVAYNNLYAGDGTTTAQSGADTTGGNVEVDSNECANDPFVVCPPVTQANFEITAASGADGTGVDPTYDGPDYEGTARAAPFDSGLDQN